MPKSITRILGPSDVNETTEAPTDLRGVRAIWRRWYVASRTIIERDATPKLLRDPVLYGIALATLVLCAQFWLYVLWLGDEGIFLHAAVRILGGEVLYRDFFELLPPGSFLAVAAWTSPPSSTPRPASHPETARSRQCSRSRGSPPRRASGP